MTVVKRCAQQFPFIHNKFSICGCSSPSAPLQQPPAVRAAIAAYLDRAPVEVLSATLAPVYIGLYLVEIRLPAIVNAGPAELYITADGQESNRVRIQLEP